MFTFVNVHTDFTKTTYVGDFEPQETYIPKDKLIDYLDDKPNIYSYY